MGWLSSFFSSSSEYSRNGQTLSSTHEAFSLPTSSPTFPPQSDVFVPSTPDFDSAASSYTYPPQGKAAYGYVSTSSWLNSRPNSASILPLHHPTGRPPLSSKLNYPSLTSTWDRIRAWLDREYPELGDTLNYGILPQDLEQIELQLGFALPSVLRESYLYVDGQEAESAAGCSEGLFFGLKFLPLEDVLEEWRFWREVDDDPTTGANAHLRQTMQSIPQGWVRKEYSNRGWIPLIADKAGNYVGVDLNPDEKGSAGQVIVFGRDFDTKVVLWRGDGLTGWARWLASFADELESGEGIDVGGATETSDDSEDDVGYESYYYEGAGRGQGDGWRDSGLGGGLRLAGEYRGWSTLEAWADRSLRRWYQAGVISDASLVPVSEGLKPSEKESSKTVEVPFVGGGDGEEHTHELPAANMEMATSNGVPVISVTKAPAPKPVVLPMPDDIIPVSESPPSLSSLDPDVELARSPSTFHEQSNLIIASTRSKSQPTLTLGNSESESNTTSTTLSINSTSITKSYSVSSAGPSSAPAVSTGSIPDLLADSVPTMHTKPISPSSPSPALAELVDTKDSKVESASAPVSESQSDTSAICGGRAVGMASDANTFTEEPEAESVTQLETKKTSFEVAIVTSPTTSGPTGVVKSKHKKTLSSSLSGLKKLTNIPGIRKKDSLSSLKGAA